MAEEKITTIDLMDEEGNKFSFEPLLTFDVDDEFYIAMLPMQPIDDFEEDEVLIMRIKEDEEGGETYLPIESQEELNMLWDIFQEIYYAEDDEEYDDEEADAE